MINFEKVPFEEAIQYFRDKVKLPTERWTDIWQGMHSRAFVVAGATKTELLTDFYNAIEKAIREGSTITDFRKVFDETVARSGWSYNGSRGWRTAVIFDTNMRTAYAAGNYRQMMDTRASRPFWRYLGGLSEHPRELHLRWSGTTLRYDDPWWDTHFPPNGWGCKCEVVSQSDREITRLEKQGVKISRERPNDGAYLWANPNTGEIIDVPNGIDPGWAYNPGKTAWGERVSKEVMDAWMRQGEDLYERLTPGDWQSYGLPGRVVGDGAKASVDYSIEQSPMGMETALTGILGGEEKVYSFQSKDFRYDVLVDAHNLASHINPDRAPYLPFLAEAMEDPAEIWLSFERNKVTGKVVLRQRIIKVVKLDKDRAIYMVLNARNGMMEAWTFMPVSDPGYINKKRVGKLVWQR